MLEVLPVGTKVKLHEDMDGFAAAGIITAISIRVNDHLAYEVSWFKAGERKSEWVEAFEVQATEQFEKKRIGFRT